MSDGESLDRAACLDLLKSVGLGRVAWAAHDGRVVVEPVNFVLDDEGVVFRTGEGEKLDAVRSGRAFSFGADEVEPALRVGWSVLVSGRGRSWETSGGSAPPTSGCRIRGTRRRPAVPRPHPDRAGERSPASAAPRRGQLRRTLRPLASTPFWPECLAGVGLPVHDEVGSRGSARLTTVWKCRPRAIGNTVFR